MSHMIFIDLHLMGMFCSFNHFKNTYIETDQIYIYIYIYIYLYIKLASVCLSVCVSVCSCLNAALTAALINLKFGMHTHIRSDCAIGYIFLNFFDF